MAARGDSYQRLAAPRHREVAEGVGCTIDKHSRQRAAACRKRQQEAERGRAGARAQVEAELPGGVIPGDIAKTCIVTRLGEVEPLLRRENRNLKALRISECASRPVRYGGEVVHMELRHQCGVVTRLAGIDHLLRNRHRLLHSQVLHAINGEEVFIHKLRNLLIDGNDRPLAGDELHGSAAAGHITRCPRVVGLAQPCAPGVEVCVQGKALRRRHGCCVCPATPHHLVMAH